MREQGDMDRDSLTKTALQTNADAPGGNRTFVPKSRRGKWRKNGEPVPFTDAMSKYGRKKRPLPTFLPVLSFLPGIRIDRNVVI